MSLCKWLSMYKYCINENVQNIKMLLYAIDMTNQPSNVFIQGHGDWHTQPHQDSLHVGVLAHPAPTGPTQQGQGYLDRTPCCTTGLTLHPSGILLLLCHYLINICFAFPFRLVGYLGLTRLYSIIHYPIIPLSHLNVAQWVHTPTQDMIAEQNFN